MKDIGFSRLSHMTGKDRQKIITWRRKHITPSRESGYIQNGLDPDDRGPCMSWLESLSVTANFEQYRLGETGSGGYALESKQHRGKEWYARDHR